MLITGNRMKKVGLITILLIFLSACSSQPHDHALRISTTTWIGYVPLFYAKEKGWLDEIDIKLINVVSLSENMYLYNDGNSDAYCGTQYEYSALKAQIPSLVPVMLFDRSNGGDIILSNHTISELENSRDKIDAYLEMDSINFTLLEDFIKRYKIDESRINYINRDQSEIATLENKDNNRLMLIITYIPFNVELEKNGFKEILSTKNGLELFVVDALFTTKEELNFHKDQFNTLNRLNNKAIAALKKDPKEFFETVKPYMSKLNFQEFQEALDDIVWVNNKTDEELKKRMHQASFPTKDLL